MSTGIDAQASVLPRPTARPPRRRRGAAVIALVAATQLCLPPGPQASPWPAREVDTLVPQWNSAALQAVRDSKLGPPMVARALAIIQTCIYDAWAAYDPTAVGTRLGSALRRPALAPTTANRQLVLAEKQEAVSFAAYRAGVDLFPGDAGLFGALMRQLGYDPADLTLDTSTPAGVGNVACGAVL
ncbi:MAG TPA: hypothetical protein VKY26_12245, partial [Actinomycetota bacterium]|nr:hypothetical protein [Actinomycetota bacterium]